MSSAQSIFKGDYGTLFLYQNCLVSILLFLVSTLWITQVFIHFPITKVTALGETSTNAYPLISLSKGNISEVYNNNTIQINGTLNVKLSFVKPYYNDTLKQEDSTHYTSVVCPIRSPAIVYIESQITNQSKSLTAVTDNSYSVNGLLYCQSASVADTLTHSSINEDLLALKVAIFDNSSCKNFEKMLERFKTTFTC